MILAAAGLAGFAALTLEVLGVHWLAPWFGASVQIWTNQIGIVLLAMAAGAWIGGRRARASGDPIRLAGGLMFGAGLLLVAGLAALPAFAEWILPDELLLSEAGPVFFRGSLGTALVFFAPPVFLLAMVAPLLVEARAKARGAGRAAGELSAAGTLGSLVGVFGSNTVAIPYLGLRLTLALTAAAMLLAGLLLTRAPRRAGALVLLAFAPLLASDPARAANLPRDPRGAVAEVLAAVETPYQHLRVVEFRDGSRWLQMNEGLDSFQAVQRPQTAWPGGYYDAFVLAPLYALEGAEPGRDWRIWILGHGAGSLLGPVAAGLRGVDWHATGVELDPAVGDLAARFLPLHPELARRVDVVLGADGRSMLRTAPRDLDLLLVDAYARQFEIPLHLSTVEFFEEAAAHLRVGGVLALNVGTAETAGTLGDVAGALRAGLAVAFEGRVRTHAVAASRNVLLFARKGVDLPPLSYLADALPAGVPIAVGAACLPDAVVHGHDPATSPPPLTDDRNPLALAQSRQWLEGGE
ncbi:MAG TPA: fused MFS/spermidine synthase [Planctomycetota bacterium]